MSPNPVTPGLGRPAFESAWREGRQRRRKKLLLSGGGSLAVCAAVLASLTAVSTARTDSLEQLDPATGASSSPQAVTAAPEQPTATTATSTMPGEPKANGSTDGATSTTEARGTGDAPQSAAYRGSPSRPVKRTYREAAGRQEGGGLAVDGGDRTVCGVETGKPAGGYPRWCTNTTISAAGRDFAVAHSACAYDTKRSLTFATSQEVEYEIRDQSGAVIWRWSDHASIRRTAHSLSASNGGCFKWTTTWSPRHANGAALEAGSYVLRAWVTAPELGAATHRDQEFSYAGS
jgi:hypothetical protein